ncbi:MAG: hypothetical protein HYT69_02625 [Candidatus Zambryskibacteria bacterium]|nr:hypothetical protein [Candidatus Zambryskibacteria bacterium]
MRWHPDPECDQAIVRLLDALCSWERSTGRESLLVLVPVEHDEHVVVAHSGKPLDLGKVSYENVCEQVRHTLEVHDDPDAHSFMG